MKPKRLICNTLQARGISTGAIKIAFVSPNSFWNESSVLGSYFIAETYLPCLNEFESTTIKEADFVYYRDGSSKKKTGEYNLSQKMLTKDSIVTDAKWMSSYHMPRWMSRCSIDIKNWRNVNIRSISEIDCEAALGYNPGELGNDAYFIFRRNWEQFNPKRDFDTAKAIRIEFDLK